MRFSELNLQKDIKNDKIKLDLGENSPKSNLEKKMIIKRPKYLDKLISHKHNKRIKIITGMRRCGKSFLLFELFKEYLKNDGTSENNIIEIQFDDIKNKKLRNAEKCYEYITSRINNSENIYYILLDEIQMLDDFVDVLNGLLHIKNIDIYVTGSNSKFLSSDIATEFRGRGDEIQIHPLSFSEFYNSQSLEWEEAWENYYTFGGLPYILELNNDEDKIVYLQNLFKETYLQDIIERNKIKNTQELESLVDILASSVGSLTNPQKLSNTFQSSLKTRISAPALKKYCDYLQEAFLIKEAKRYNIKGKKYINTPIKYYFEDIGLRNARLNFRQQEENHIIENIIFNELRYRGFVVDVGVIEIKEKNAEMKYEKKQIEIDFIANQGSKRYYIQSAFAMPTIEKKLQEERPLKKVNDSFKKIIVVKDNIKLKRDDYGIITIGLKEFLLNNNSLDS